jgi:hypothetical protein
MKFKKNRGKLKKEPQLDFQFVTKLSFFVIEEVTVKIFFLLKFINFFALKYMLK